MEADMKNAPDIPLTARALPCVVGALALFAATLALTSRAASSPAVGDSYEYRLVNGHNHEALGQIRYRVDRVDADRITVSVTPDSSAAGVQRTEIYTKEGNWLKHPVESHGGRVEYEFATAYPAYVFPLDTGKSWSVRVDATVAGERKTRRVGVDGKVLGSERIRVPAGEFDTVKIRRLVYPGDWDYFLMETKIVETEWYAPALGRAVRTEIRSEYFDQRRARPFQLQYGDWNVFELVEVRAAKP
jgi:hypothetical protein